MHVSQVCRNMETTLNRKRKQGERKKDAGCRGSSTTTTRQHCTGQTKSNFNEAKVALHTVTCCSLAAVAVAVAVAVVSVAGRIVAAL